MKKIIFLAVFALCSFATLESCKKTEAVSDSPKEEFFEGDEYDRGVVIEEPEEVEDVEENDYNPEGVKIISAIGTIGNDNLDKDGCDQLKYGIYCPVGYGIGNDILFTLSSQDSAISVTTNNVNIQIDADALESQTGTTFHVAASMIDTNYNFKTKSVKFIVTLKSGKVVSKSVKLINITNTSWVYGTSGWLAKLYKDRYSIQSGAYNSITSSYTPMDGDYLLFFNATTNVYKEGVIVKTPVSKTKNGITSWKFKIREMNARCNGRITTKSITTSQMTDIRSSDGVTTAVSYQRR